MKQTYPRIRARLCTLRLLEPENVADNFDLYHTLAELRRKGLVFEWDWCDIPPVKGTVLDIRGLEADFPDWQFRRDQE